MNGEVLWLQTFDRTLEYPRNRPLMHNTLTTGYRALPISVDIYTVFLRAQLLDADSNRLWTFCMSDSVSRYLTSCSTFSYM